jgi:hypothetical protein
MHSKLVFGVLKAPIDFKFNLSMSRTSLRVYVNFKTPPLMVEWRLRSLHTAID